MRLFGEIIKVSLHSLMANKLKSFLTILGVIFGIFSIISISTVISMLQTNIENGIGGLGKNTFQIQKRPAMGGGDRAERMRARKRKDIEFEHYVELKERFSEAKSIGAEQWGFSKIIQYGNEKTNPDVSISGITPEAQENNDWVVESGRPINSSDVDRSERVTVIGVDIVKKLFSNINPIGQSIKVDGHRLRVVGVLESKGDLFGQSQDNFILLPLSTFQGFYGRRSRSVNITVKVRAEDNYLDMIEKATAIFRVVRKVPVGEPEDFDVWSNESLISNFNDTTQGVKIGALVIGMIALIAAGVGIMNIMLVSVTERTKEIGIRKSIGAKKSNILVQFLIEALVLCLAGGLIGIAMGVTAGNLVGSLMNATALIPVDWVIVGVLLCTGIGVGFGVYPAYKAANLDPIEALRYE
ncbi:MAG: ABC transporter permease [Rhodothermaceae bacterium]